MFSGFFRATPSWGQRSSRVSRLQRLAFTRSGLSNSRPTSRCALEARKYLRPKPGSRGCFFLCVFVLFLFSGEVRMDLD